MRGARLQGLPRFCTSEGLSRFDGYTFTNYTTDGGLPDRRVRAFLQSRRGEYFVATGSGLARFETSRDGRNAPFTLYRPDDPRADPAIFAIAEDAKGAIFCGGEDGLYRLERSEKGGRLRAIDIGLPDHPRTILALLADRQGSLWIGALSGLYRRWADGRVERYSAASGIAGNDVRALLEDRCGRVWVGTKFGGLRLLVADPRPDQPIVARAWTRKDGLPGDHVNALLERGDGSLWIGAYGGISALSPPLDERASVTQTFTTKQGLSGIGIWALAEDTDGNLWMGTEDSGAMKLARGGFVTYTEEDGLGSSRVYAIFEDLAGDLCVVTPSTDVSRRANSWFLNRVHGNGFVAMTPRLGAGVDFGWGWSQVTFQDREGDWWQPSTAGLYRFAGATTADGLDTRAPSRVYTVADGLPGNEIFRLYEDAHGNVWISVFGSRGGKLARLDRRTQHIQAYTTGDGLPDSEPTAFAEDGDGSLWIGFYAGGLARYRDGRFRVFSTGDGVPPGMVRQLYRDTRGRVWLATSLGGAARIENAAGTPRFVPCTTREGLSSNDVWCVTSDSSGRMYFGTGRGLDTVDASSGAVKHYTSNDGLAPGTVQVAFRDRHEHLWFGTLHGLSRLVTEQTDSRDTTTLPVFISRLRIGGLAYPLSAIGERAVARVSVPADRNDVQIEFIGIDFAAGADLRYQVRLEGVTPEWAAPETERSVNYSGLAPGSYRFAVRAVRSDGLVSSTPALVDFTVVAPLWRRGWFLGLVALGLTLLGVAAFRYRVNQLLKVERVRTRIATDLHDDVGASLSRIAILSEVVKRETGVSGEHSAQLLGEIAETARTLVDDMNDIVWSVDPRKDDLGSLLTRVVHFGSEVFEARKIRWECELPARPEAVRLTADQRHHLYLILKEAITNIARHAGCTAASLTVAANDRLLTARLHDNGTGIDQVTPCSAFGGHGLENMQERAKELGGQVTIDSQPGGGTTVSVVIPIRG